MTVENAADQRIDPSPVQATISIKKQSLLIPSFSLDILVLHMLVTYAEITRIYTKFVSLMKIKSSSFRQFH